MLFLAILTIEEIINKKEEYEYLLSIQDLNATNEVLIPLH